MSEPITPTQWAREHEFSKQYAFRLIKAGLVPSLPDGKLDREKANEALEAMREIKPSDGESLAALLTKARINSEIQRGELAKLSRLKKEGILVERVKVDRENALVDQMVRDCFLSMPERLADKLAALTDAHQVRDEIKADVLQSLARLSTRIENVGTPVVV